MPRISDWKIKQVIFGQALDEIEELFMARGCIFMPIKGAYLIMHGLAATIPDRTIRDIDLLLPEAAFDDTCNWFAALPNVTEMPNYWNFERSFAYTMGGSAVYCEFHRQINFPARFLLPTTDLFHRGHLQTAACILPDPVDAQLIHTCHMLAHVIDGFNWNAINEIGLLAGQPGYSWSEFWKRTERTGIRPFLHLLIGTYNQSDHFQSTPLPKACSWYVTLLLRTGLFRKIRFPLGRKLLFELPFVRNPWWLLRYKSGMRRPVIAAH